MRNELKWGILSAGLALTACAPNPSTPAPLRVAAASDLQAAFPALIAGFHQHSGETVEMIAGASGQLSQQVRQGAPFDVFLSADLGFVAKLAEAGAIRPDSVRPYAIGSLVLAVYRESPAGVSSLGDLARPEIQRVSIANPEHAPYGRAAKQALERAGLWESLRPKIVQAETVRQALQFVRTGNADAGLVGRAISDVPEVRIVTIDPALHEPIVQGLGIVAASARPESAAAFTRFLLGADGQRILAQYGFRPPDPIPPK